MTAREAYDCDPTFRALVDEWARLRRCPVPLVDRCLDFALETQAECARWAAHAPDRRGWEDGTPPPAHQGTYPAHYENRWFWVAVAPTDERHGSASYYLDVRRLVREISWSTDRFEDVASALLELLDSWKPA